MSVFFFNGTTMKWSSIVGTFGNKNCLFVQKFFCNSSLNGLNHYLK
jgi:hypothetical protein